MATIYRCTKCDMEVTANSSSDISHLRNGIQCPGTGTRPYSIHTFIAVGNDSRAGRANLNARDAWREEQENKHGAGGASFYQSSFSSGGRNRSNGGGFFGKLFLGIAAIVILGLVNGGPELFTDLYDGIFNQGLKGEDPKNYYGTYYFNEGNTNLIKVEIFQNGQANVTDNYGINTPFVSSYSYEYVSREYAYSKLQNDTYQGFDSVFIYTTPDKNQVLPLWVVDKTPNEYRFLYGLSGRTIGYGSTTVLTFQSIMNDPKDYFGTYVYGASSLIVKSDETIDLIEGTRKSYQYRYVTNVFLRRYFSQSNYNEALVVFEPNASSYLIFGIINNNTIEITSGGSTYSFVK